MDVDDSWSIEEVVSLSDVAEEDEEGGEFVRQPNGIRGSEDSTGVKDNACVRVLEGHTQAVTALYFEDECLVSFFEDITLI